jgi:hypothetical protein
MCLWAHTIIYCIYGDVQHYCLDAAHSALAVYSDTQWAIPHKRHYQDALIPPYSYSHIHTHIYRMCIMLRSHARAERGVLWPTGLFVGCAQIYFAPQKSQSKEMLQLPWPINFHC